MDFLNQLLFQHSIFSYFDLNQQEKIIKYGILLINNIIIIQKSCDYYEKELKVPDIQRNDSHGLDISLSREEEDDTEWSSLDTTPLISRKGLIKILCRLSSHIPLKSASRHPLKVII